MKTTPRFYDKTSVCTVRNGMYAFIRRSSHCEYFGTPNEPLDWDTIHTMDTELIGGAVEMLKIYIGLYDESERSLALSSLIALYLKDLKFRATIDRLVNCAMGSEYERAKFGDSER